MAQTVRDKVVIVTGASSGIGAATAREFARQGARVVLAARNTKALDALVVDIKHAGGQAIAVPTDMTDTAQIERLLVQTRDAYGHVDILVNNAGANWGKPLADTSAEEVENLLKVNLLGMMELTRLVLPEMQQRHQGTIIAVGSVASHVALEPLYSATKFGVRGFSLALRRQLTGSGVSVCLVTPGNIRTQMTSALDEQMPEPLFVANAIVRLAIAPKREIILPFKYHGVVWLDKLFPSLADAAFQWRHRHDREEGNMANLPAYASNTVGV